MAGQAQPKPKPKPKRGKGDGGSSESSAKGDGVSPAMGGGDRKGGIVAACGIGLALGATLAFNTKRRHERERENQEAEELRSQKVEHCEEIAALTSQVEELLEAKRCMAEELAQLKATANARQCTGANHGGGNGGGSPRGLLSLQCSPSSSAPSESPLLWQWRAPEGRIEGEQERDRQARDESRITGEQMGKALEDDKARSGRRDGDTVQMDATVMDAAQTGTAAADAKDAEVSDVRAANAAAAKVMGTAATVSGDKFGAYVDEHMGELDAWAGVPLGGVLTAGCGVGASAPGSTACTDTDLGFDVSSVTSGVSSTISVAQAAHTVLM